MATGGDAWLRMALDSMPKPAWIETDGPSKAIALSTRVRVMRNLRGHRFPNRIDSAEATTVMNRIVDAARRSDLEANKNLTNAERDYLVGCRLVSPDFEWTLPGRAVLTDRDRRLSLMVNEEDHLRVQAILDLGDAETLARATLAQLADSLEFAWSPHYGYLAASPGNLGTGVRFSGMFHLIGLAHLKRLPAIIKALGSLGVVTRGLFGEHSRAIGAFAQVSTTTGNEPEFRGAVTYLLQEEDRARAEIPAEDARKSIADARRLVENSRVIGLAEAVRVVGFLRWEDLLEERPTLESDRSLAALGLRPSLDESEAGRKRATLLQRLASER